MDLTVRIARIPRLIEREVTLRERARALELDPDRTQEAAQLFRRADRAARVRLALARRCGLL